MRKGGSSVKRVRARERIVICGLGGVSSGGGEGREEYVRTMDQ